MPLDTSIAFGNYGRSGGGASANSDPFELINNLSALRLNQQKMKENDLQLKERQNKIDNDEAIDAALKSAVSGPDGQPDWNKALNQLHSQGRGSAALGLQNRVFEWRKSQAETLKTELANNDSRVKMALSMAQGISDPASFTRIKSQVAKVAGPEAAAMLGDTYDPETIKSAIVSGRSASDNITATHNAIDDAMKVMDQSRLTLNSDRDWAKAQPELAQKWTNVASGYLSLAKNQNDWDQALNKLLPSAMDPLPQSLKDQVIGQFAQQYSPAAVEQARKLGMTQHERSQEGVERGRLAMEQARAAAEEGGAAALTPEAIDMLALKVAKAGNMDGVPMGLGKTATQQRDKIYNRAAEMFPNLDLATQQAAYNANKGSLNNLQKTMNNLGAFESTALKNLQLFLQEAKGVVDSGSPLINKPLRSIEETVFGDPKMAGFNTARRVVVPEFGRILQGGPALNGVLSDAARGEVDDTMKGAYTLKQLYKSAEVLVKDASNRRMAYQEQIDGLKKVIGNPPAVTPATKDTISTFGGGGGTVQMRTPDGRTISVPAAQVAEAKARGAVEIR